MYSNLKTQLFTAQPTNPSDDLGLCKNRISKGAIPSTPKSIVCNNFRSDHE